MYWPVTGSTCPRASTARGERDAAAAAPPAVTEPPAARTRVHTPARHPYESFRACLRQDFEYTCALCLLHESDLAPLGVEGTGLFTVEHIEPQSTRPDLAEVYRNCLYACRFCNTRRGDLSVRRADGARLLDPTRDGWSDAFEARDDRLEPKKEGAVEDAGSCRRSRRADLRRRRRRRDLEGFRADERRRQEHHRQRATPARHTPTSPRDARSLAATVLGLWDEVLQDVLRRSRATLRRRLLRALSDRAT